MMPVGMRHLAESERAAPPKARASLETWSAGGHGFVYLYTDDYEVNKALRQILRERPTTYEHSGHLIGWQFSCRRDRLGFIMRKIKSMQNQGLTTTGSEKDRPGATISTPDDERHAPDLKEGM